MFIYPPLYKHYLMTCCKYTKVYQHTDLCKYSEYFSLNVQVTPSFCMSMYLTYTAEYITGEKHR